jgi:hypothetical protein
MSGIRIETKIERDGVLHLTGLPFKAGDRVEVVLLPIAQPPVPAPSPTATAISRPLPFDGVDVVVYWRNFPKERKTNYPCLEWFTNSERLVRYLHSGDRLWMIASGASCGLKESKLGYLVELFYVRAAGPNPGTNPAYLPGDFLFSIRSDATSCVAIDPPLLVDQFLRGETTSKDLAIGTVRQGASRLRKQAASALRAHLLAQRPDLRDFLLLGQR